MRSTALAVLSVLGLISNLAIRVEGASAAPAAWSVTTSPDPNNHETLTGVSCTSPTNCVAVGSFFNESINVSASQPLVETWDGASWSLASSPNEDNNGQLEGVSCTTPTNCVAVGSFYTSNPHVVETLVETWDGTSWSITPSPNAGNTVNFLYGVSCVSAMSCVAVGEYANSSYVPQTLVETWDGTAWSITSSPNQGSEDSVDNELDGVSCINSSSCVAVGYYENENSDLQQTLAEDWDGTAWSITSSPDQGTENNVLGGVSCTSSTDCVAVGNYAGPDGGLTLVETWDGTNWSVTPSPNPGSGDGLNGMLDAVSCTSSVSCMAVGDYYVSGGPETLAETWDGTTWSTVASPDQEVSDNYLYGVSCVSSISCGAVGTASYSGAAITQTLVEIWNGMGWSITLSPNQSGLEDVLNAISCTSSTSCVAVGSLQNSSGGIYQVPITLVETWNGTYWSPTSSPDQGDLFPNTLEAVSCPSSTTCVAVGSYENGSNVDQTLVETLNGTTWSVTSSPDKGTSNNSLDAASCTSSIKCVAVGSYDQGSGSKTLIERWNGTEWSAISSPNENSYDSLDGVSCTSSTTCVAVGSYFNGSEDQTLIERGNGTEWSVSASLNPSSADGLNAVSCTGSRSCVAVGWYDNELNGIEQTLVESLNGTSWSVTSSPNQGAVNRLGGASCVSSTSCVAAGFYADQSDREILVESGSSPPPPPKIKGFTPASGRAGREVTIKGTNLGDAIEVAFDGTQAAVTTDSATKITTTVPVGATTGKITITTAGGSTTSATRFKVRT